MAHTQHTSPTRPRLHSGVPGFDELVDGGLFRQGVYMLNGAPGTGKTVFASQICFHAVARGEQALYVTLFSELHGNMIANLSSLSFFDPAAIGRKLQVVSAGRSLAQAGLDGVLEMIRSTVREERPSVLILDGFRAVEHAAWSPVKVTMFVQNLQALVSLTSTTALLVSNSAAGEPSPEQALVDGVIDLEDRVFELRGARSVCVRKFRGGPHLGGRHFMSIDAGGIRVWPRLEAREPSARLDPNAATGSGRIYLGIPGLDRLLGGGVEARTTTLVLGPAGAGKTVLGMHYLAEGARQGERGVLFGFFEDPATVLARARQFDLALDTAVDEELIELCWWPMAERNADELAAALLAAVRARPTRRLVIDGLVGFEQSLVYKERLARFFSALSIELRRLDVTSLITEETRQLVVRDVEVPIEGVSAIWENILLLKTEELDDRLERVVVVLKTRGSAHDQGLYRFTIGEKGFTLGERYRGTSAARTGNQAPRGGAGAE